MIFVSTLNKILGRTWINDTFEQIDGSITVSYAACI